jgi:hypothetical protein
MASYDPYSINLPCAACSYWSGRRQLSHYRTRVEADPSERARCVHPDAPGWRGHTCPSDHCELNERWRAIPEAGVYLH